MLRKYRDRPRKDGIWFESTVAGSSVVVEWAARVDEDDSDGIAIRETNGYRIKLNARLEGYSVREVLLHEMAHVVEWAYEAEVPHRVIDCMGKGLAQGLAPMLRKTPKKEI